MQEKEWPSEYKKVPTEEFSEEKPDVSEPANYGYGMRHIQCFLLFFCVTIAYMARAHLGVSVVAMTRQNDEKSIIKLINSDTESIAYGNETEIELNETSARIFGNESDANEVADSEKRLHHNDTLVSLVNDYGTETLWNVYRTYEWTKATQEMILSAFFLGYSVTMFPMGMLVQRLGGKLSLQIGLLVNGIVSLVTPTVAVWGGWKAVCVCRVVQGISQSGLYPSVHTILAKWIPLRERATFVGYVYTGTTLGTIISFQLGGLLASSTAGWPSTFWIVGASCLVAFTLLTVFGAATPADHKTISEEERKYIMGADGPSDPHLKPKTPFKQIFCSKHVWAALTSHFFCGICFVFLFTQMPTYMHYVLGFNIKSSGMLSSLPYVGSFFFAIAYGVLSDYFVNRGIVTLKTTRIVCNTLGQVVPAACLIAVSFTDNVTLAVVLIVAAVSLYAGIHTGWMVNYIDLSPNFSGSLMAIGNTACGAGVLSLPVLVSNIVTEVTDRSQWRIVMFIMAGTISFGNLIYVFLMSTDKQSWDNIDGDHTETEAKPMKTK